MSNETFIKDIKNVNYNSVIKIHPDDYINSLLTTDSELATKFFIIKEDDSNKIKYEKAKNQHNLLKFLNSSSKLLEPFINHIGKNDFLNIIYNSTMFFNYGSLLHEILNTIPESINKTIPYQIEKKANFDYIISKNEATFEETFVTLMDKMSKNIYNLISVYPQFYKPEIKKHFSESVFQMIENKRMEILNSKETGYHHLFFIDGWQNIKYNEQDTISLFISNINMDKQLVNNPKIADKLKYIIENNPDYFSERNNHLLQEMIRTGYSRWPEMVDYIPVPSNNQINNIDVPLFSYMGFLNIKDKDMRGFFNHFSLEQVIGNKEQQKEILNQFLSPDNQYLLLHGGSYVKSNFSLTLKNMHDYIRHTKQQDKVEPELWAFFTFINNIMFKEQHNKLCFTENLSFPLFEKISNSSFFYQLHIITKLKPEDFQDIENILKSEHEHSILNNVLSDINDKNIIKKRL